MWISSSSSRQTTCQDAPLLTASSDLIIPSLLLLASSLLLLLANGLAPHPLISRPVSPEDGATPTEAPDNGSNSFGAVLQVNRVVVWIDCFRLWYFSLTSLACGLK